VVQPDAGGQREQFGGDAGSSAVEGAGVVAFQAEAVFEGEEDRLDALADPGQHRPAARLVFAGRAQDPRPVALRGLGFELAAGIALVADDQLAAVQADGEQP